MAGSTSTIDLSVLRVQWDSHSAMASICAYWSITKDQLIRLKTVANLAPRHDRALRWGGQRGEPSDPSPREIKRACLEIQSRWDERTREERSVLKRQSATLRFLPVPEEAEDAVREHNSE